MGTLKLPMADNLLVCFANFVWRLKNMVKLALFLKFYYFYHVFINLIDKKSRNFISDHNFLNKVPTKCRKYIF